MTRNNFKASARIIGMMPPNEWLIELQEWPEGHWVGHSNGTVVIERKHIQGNAKVGDFGILSFDSNRDALWEFIPNLVS